MLPRLGVKSAVIAVGAASSNYFYSLACVKTPEKKVAVRRSAHKFLDRFLCKSRILSVDH
jgi:hypothetical protein